MQFCLPEVFTEKKIDHKVDGRVDDGEEVNGFPGERVEDVVVDHQRLLTHYPFQKGQNESPEVTAEEDEDDDDEDESGFSWLLFQLVPAWYSEKPRVKWEMAHWKTETPLERDQKHCERDSSADDPVLESKPNHSTRKLEIRN